MAAMQRYLAAAWRGVAASAAATSSGISAWQHQQRHLGKTWQHRRSGSVWHQRNIK